MGGDRISGGVLGLESLLRKFRVDEEQRRDTRLVTARLAALVRYGGFVDETIRRFRLSSERAQAAHEAAQACPTASGFGPMSPEDRAIWDESGRASRAAEVDIESFYVFAKILLDRWAQFVGVYFGPEPKVFKKEGLQAHGGFADQRLQRYAASKQLTPVPQRLCELADELDKQLVAFRTVLAHEKNAHAYSMLIPSPSSSPVATIVRVDLSPQPSPPTIVAEQLMGSGQPDRLLVSLNQYFTEWTLYIEANAGRCCL